MREKENQGKKVREEKVGKDWIKSEEKGKGFLWKRTSHEVENCETMGNSCVSW